MNSRLDLLGSICYGFGVMMCGKTDGFSAATVLAGGRREHAEQESRGKVENCGFSVHSQFSPNMHVVNGASEFPGGSPTGGANPAARWESVSETPQI